MSVTVPMLDLKAEYDSLRDEIDQAIRRVIESGNFTLGEEVETFEAEFAEYCGAAYAVGVGSGTAAIQLALLACGIGPGDEVITVPNTDLPTVAAISHCGARFVWVDVDPRTFNIDPDQIEAKITEKTRAILPVHLFGHPADMDPIREIAARHNLLIIEDAALALGAEYRGQKVGTFGDAGCFSLAPGKILGAYGDAGIIVTNRRDVAERLQVLRNYGQSREMARELTQPGGIRAWRLVTEGFNERLDTLQAAIVRAKLPTLDERIARRREAAARYTRLLADLDVVTPHEAAGARHVFRAYTILVENRERVRDFLASRGIATRLYYTPPLHLQPVYAHLGYQPGDFPVAEATGARILSLPLFPEISDDQIEEVVTALAAIVPARDESGTSRLWGPVH